MARNRRKKGPLPVVITPDYPGTLAAAGSPWDCWDDRRHGPAEHYPTCTEEAVLRWEELLGRQ